MHEDVLVKATPYRALAGYLGRQLTPEARARVWDQTGREFPPYQAILGKRTMLASEQVPVLLMNRLIELSAAELRVPPEQLAQKAGHEGAKEAASLTFRFAMAVLSMPNLIRKISPGWKQLHTHGRINAECGERSARIDLVDYPIVSKVTCARVTGWFEWFSTAAEKTARTRHVKCRVAGDPVEAWVVEW